MKFVYNDCALPTTLGACEGSSGRSIFIQRRLYYSQSVATRLKIALHISNVYFNPSFSGDFTALEVKELLEAVLKVARSLSVTTPGVPDLFFLVPYASKIVDVVFWSYSR